MPYKLVEHNGKLAATLGWANDWEKPEVTRKVWVSNIPILDARGLAGLEVRNLRDDQGMVQRAGAVRPTRIDMGTWKAVTESRPVKKPRKGKRQGMAYDWTWVRGEWQRVWID